MGTYAKVIADSVSPNGNRITTLELKYWRFIHAEFLTHRMFSRNASSSRAIPVKKTIQTILDDPAIPIYWGKNQKGMQADYENHEFINIDDILYSSKDAWLKACDSAVNYARAFEEAGYHKQIVNRILEPFSWITVCVTSTDWNNFFRLRDHEAAQPETKNLAKEMRSHFDNENDYEILNVHMKEITKEIKFAVESSQPRLIALDDWHLPYLLPDESFDNETAKKLSTARCARVSYKTHDNIRPSISQDLNLYESLLKERHVSPFEHQATPISVNEYIKNYYGWMSHRVEIPEEYVR
jgi:thymidylate synthase ThyX